MSSFWQLFLMNARVLYRNPNGLFFTLLMPLALLVGVTLLPIPLESLIVGAAKNYKDFLLPGMVALTVMQSGIYNLAYWMVDFKTKGVAKRFLVTPMQQGQLVVSLILARLVIITTLGVLLTVIGSFLLRAQVVWAHVPAAIPVIMLGGLTFLCIGLLISTFAKSYETAAPITSAVGLPMTLFGNVFFATQKLPQGLQVVADKLPISAFARLLREFYLTQTLNWTVILPDLILLSGWFLLLLMFVLWRFRLNSAV